MKNSRFTKVSLKKALHVSSSGGTGTQSLKAPKKITMAIGGGFRLCRMMIGRKCIRLCMCTEAHALIHLWSLKKKISHVCMHSSIK